MTAPETAFLVLAVLLQAPVSFRLGAATRDGRERAAGFLYLALSSGAAAFVGFFSRSPVLAVFAAWGLAVVLAHARFMSAFAAPHPAALPGAPDAASFSSPPQPSAASQPPRPNPILAGISFLADVMVITDRIGELRHRRRVRRAEYARTRQEISNDSSRTGKSRKPQHIPYYRFRSGSPHDTDTLPPS